MGYYKINKFLTKNTKKSKIVLNMTKQKKPFLYIINNLLNKIKTKNVINTKECGNKKLNVNYAVFLPFYLKHSYFKK